MRRACTVGLALLAFVASAHGDTPTSVVVLALTSTDALASSADFVAAFSGSAEAVTGLAAIAQDSSGDTGVQLRAIRGLAEFPASGSVPHDALVAIIGASSGAQSGSRVLVLRAAIESLGALAAGGHAEPADEALLAGHLNDGSRDVRATTARALGELCDTSAATPLHVRAGGETSVQVKLAISEALRVLATCSPS